MTISQAQFTLGTVAELVVPPDRNPQRAYIHNQETGTSKLIYFGNKDVTINDGVHLDAGEFLYLTLNRGEALYALSEPAGYSLGVLRQRMDE